MTILYIYFILLFLTLNSCCLIAPPVEPNISSFNPQATIPTPIHTPSLFSQLPPIATPSPSPSLNAGDSNPAPPQIRPEPSPSTKSVYPEYLSSGSSSGSSQTPSIPTISSSASPNWWNDVSLAENNMSIVGQQAPTQLKGDMTEIQPIELMLTGNFETTPELTPDCFRFTPEFGLRHQMYQGNGPK